MIEFIKRYSLAAWALFFVMLSYILVDMLRLPEPLLWASRILIIIVIIRNSEKVRLDSKAFNLTFIFIGWLFFEVIRAVFIAENYWMFKSVINQLLLALFYSVIILSSNLKIVQDYFAIYWRLLLPMVGLCLLGYGSPLNYNYVPFSILILFIGAMPKKHAWLLIFIMIGYFIASEQRNDMIKIVLSATIGLTIMVISIPKLVVKVGQIFFLIVPFILLFLGTTGVFNIFKMDEYIKGDYTQQITTNNGVEVDDLKADTRTFIYRNVFYTLAKYGDFPLGRSPALGDEGFQGSWGRDEATGLIGRYGNEVGVMDILLWYGLVGVALYFLLFVRASYLAIYKSRSKYAKGVGLYMSFLWTWSFIWEKPLVETFFMMDLILMGLCLSKQFRMMTDQDIQYWIKGVFLVRRKRRFIKT